MGIIKKKAFERLPQFIKPFALKIYYTPIDLRSFLKDESERVIPPKRMTSLVGDGDFEKIGKHLLHALIEIAGLKPNERVLDVGCGIGRVAIPLMDYMKGNGCYEGFDIVPHEIKWCQKNISSRYSNFHFQLADIYNGVYNAAGKYKASNYKFPYKDESFDFVFLTSVFTHMLTEDMENYLSEIVRVLRKGGRCFITYFLLNPETIRLMEQKQSIFDFKLESDGCCYADDKNIPEHAVAYEESFIRKLYTKNSLILIEPIYYGNWRNGKKSQPFQDFIIAKK
jgi:ubiquinone/menaquinone biosynthesis C-methylase UbiE